MQAWEHWENPDTKRRFNNLLEVSEFSEELVPLKPRSANLEQVLRFHTPEYVDRVRELSAADGGDAGEGAPFSHGGYEIALLAAGGTITAVDAVLDRNVDNAYALVRPPGHHAERDRGRGFCIFGNVAIAAMHALAERGIDKVATLDWDVHHGNGTQQAFYDRKGRADHVDPPGISGTRATAERWTNRARVKATATTSTSRSRRAAATALMLRRFSRS